MLDGRVSDLRFMTERAEPPVAEVGGITMAALAQAVHERVLAYWRGDLHPSAGIVAPEVPRPDDVRQWSVRVVAHTANYRDESSGYKLEADIESIAAMLGRAVRLSRVVQFVPMPKVWGATEVTLTDQASGLSVRAMAGYNVSSDTYEVRVSIAARCAPDPEALHWQHYVSPQRTDSSGYRDYGHDGMHG